MPAFAARTTIRATAQRRQFSLLNSLRHAARAFEPHPFQRMTTAQTAKPDYGKMVKARLVSAGFFVPTASVLLGWPVAAQQLLDGRI